MATLVTGVKVETFNGETTYHSKDGKLMASMYRDGDEGSNHYKVYLYSQFVDRRIPSERRIYGFMAANAICQEHAAYPKF